MIFPFGILLTAGRHQGQRKQLVQSQRFERQPRAQARLIDKVHFLLETSLSRLGEAALKANAQKPTQKSKENEEIEECVPNKIAR